MNYVNEAKFIEWYRGTAKPPLLSDAALLSEVFRRYAETRCSEYVLTAEQTVTGREERYPFRCETIGPAARVRRSCIFERGIRQFAWQNP